MHMVEGYDLEFKQDQRRGRLACVRPTNLAAPAIRRARESCLSVRGSKIFNLLPQHIRDINATKVDVFKRAP